MRTLRRYAADRQDSQCGTCNQAALLHDEHVLAIGGEALIVREQGQWLDQRLRHRGTIERIAMVMRKARHRGGMLQAEWQWLEPTVQRSSSHLIDIDL